jgi:hypothetical protein
VTARRRTAPDPAAELRLAEVVLPDGRAVYAGDEFSVSGEGRFRLRYGWAPDGSLCAYGPVGRQTATVRAFRPETVRTVHRSTTEVRP